MRGLLLWGCCFRCPRIGPGPAGAPEGARCPARPGVAQRGPATIGCRPNPRHQARIVAAGERRPVLHGSGRVPAVAPADPDRPEVRPATATGLSRAAAGVLFLSTTVVTRESFASRDGPARLLGGDGYRGRGSAGPVAPRKSFLVPGSSAQGNSDFQEVVSRRGVRSFRCGPRSRSRLNSGPRGSVRSANGDLPAATLPRVPPSGENPASLTRSYGHWARLPSRHTSAK